MKIKKLLGIFLSICIVISFSGCNQRAEEPQTDDDASSTTAETEDTAAVESDYSGEELELSFAHNLAVDSVLDQAANQFADLVAEKSGGKITVTVYPAAQLGNESDMLEGMELGTIDMMLGTTTYLSNVSPEFAVLDLPFLFSDVDHVKEILDGEVGEALKTDLSEQKQMRIMGYMNSGFRIMLTSDTQLVDLDSFHGVKMRSPETEVYIEMFESLGASPTPISLSETYTSIQTGVVEGVEMSAQQLYTNKFHEVTNYVARTNHIFTTVCPIISNSKWDSLSEEAQAILDESMVEVIDWEWDAFDQADEEALQSMVDAGLEVNDIDQAPLSEACSDLYKEISEKNNCADLLEMIQQ